LGLAPRYALHKVPPQCGQRKPCIYHRPNDCTATSKRRPWCFEPEGLPEDARRLGQETVQMWGEGIYIVVVQHG